jgi:hypothetical protein
MAIESGITTKNVEKFLSVQVNLDSEDTIAVADALVALQDKELFKLLTEPQAIALEKLTESVAVAAHNYISGFTEDEFTGEE